MDDRPEPCCDKPSFSMETIGEEYGPPRGPSWSKTVSTTSCYNCGWKQVVTFEKKIGQPMTMTTES